VSGDLADARRRAEEALAALDEAYGARVVARSVDCVCALRSLLAAITAEGEAKRTGPRCPFCGSDRISRDPALDCWSCETCRRSWGEHPAPQTEPGAGEREDGTVPSYPWTWERVARRVGEEFARTGPDGYDKFGPAEWQDWMLSRIYAQPPRPAQDALCPGCGGAGWIPAGDEQLGCCDCNGTGHAPAPPSTAPAAELKRRPPGHDRIGELEALLRECNAVCLCGCPASEHESYGEDGESCADEEHECIRVAPAVLAYVQDLRQQWADLGEDYEGLRARINPPHPSWDTSCARCGRDLTVSSATCGECCAETPAAGVVEVPPAHPPRPAQDAVREAAERLREHVHFEDGEDGEPVAFLRSGFEEAFLTLLAALDAAKGPK
jgi:ribosomal protein L37AE/L43A